ncbi:hypothetical protein BU14_0316s0007 [Porphyra umbilicalis]|uniref:Uncharacterized protein n=1 Tax=Porphyra umbilicalis TaxID=2786 RepID=A0A1X6NZE0_PORUM|nr:hypothetical protein BU14_0316s0007 [Porphyra umbilicalis]|eukprot:OSX73978.1 hypothetical protein BU14_0316s0007 [Porphyra umbilicalis]
MRRAPPRGGGVPVPAAAAAGGVAAVGVGAGGGCAGGAVGRGAAVAGGAGGAAARAFGSVGGGVGARGGGAGASSRSRSAVLFLSVGGLSGGRGCCGGGGFGVRLCRGGSGWRGGDPPLRMPARGGPTPPAHAPSASGRATGATLAADGDTRAAGTAGVVVGGAAAGAGGCWGGSGVPPGGDEPGAPTNLGPHDADDGDDRPDGREGGNFPPSAGTRTAPRRLPQTRTGATALREGVARCCFSGWSSRGGGARASPAAAGGVAGGVAWASRVGPSAWVANGSVDADMRAAAAAAELSRRRPRPPPTLTLETVYVSGVSRDVRQHHLRAMLADVTGVGVHAFVDADRFGTTTAVTLVADAAPAFRAAVGRGRAATVLRLLPVADPWSPALLGAAGAARWAAARTRRTWRRPTAAGA